MSLTPRDYSVFNKLNLERKPVGVKFSSIKLEGIKRLDKDLNFCEMFKEAQTGSPFYVGKEDFRCIEPMLLGMEDPDPVFISGLFGWDLKVFKEEGACRKMYQYLPRMMRGSVNFVTFASVDRLSFEPDVVVLTADLEQARPILRSVPYSTGDYISAKVTHVATCSWMYIYPVVSGQINYVITGLGAGMEAAKPFPAGLFIISIPWNLLPTMIENLPEMIGMEGGPSLSGGDELRKHHKETKESLKQKIRTDLGGA
jgi:uncharacterized protein (DUF169 family)